MSTTTIDTETHEHQGQYCNGKRYLIGGPEREYEFRPCPQAKPQRPRCHYCEDSTPATHALIWQLASGDRVKFACANHREVPGPKPYLVARLESVCTK